MVILCLEADYIIKLCEHYIYICLYIFSSYLFVCVFLLQAFVGRPGQHEEERGVGVCAGEPVGADLPAGLGSCPATPLSSIATQTPAASLQALASCESPLLCPYPATTSDTPTANPADLSALYHGGWPHDKGNPCSDLRIGRRAMPS